jgi:hypothetical protein
MLREDLAARVKNDPDYKEKKSADGKTPYEYLDRL